MAIEILRSAEGLEYEYCEYLWGDVISGNKDVLQRMGIGIGIGFPGEPGCNKRQVSTIDPRGFPCTIKLCREWQRFQYEAFIDHPGRHYQYPAEEWHEASPGVRRQANGAVDYFKGSAEALTAAGIVPAGMFPGMPGMRSVRVTILADGTLPAGHRNASHNELGRACEGAKFIDRKGRNSYEVGVWVSDELADRRDAASRLHRQAWEARMAAMPRAQRIDLNIRSEINEQPSRKRAKLCLVWSRPKFVPEFNVLPPGPFAR
ncbi:MAG: hypothetical protein FD131_4887 [Rhodocyclaceae bacterium]|nr:MAG: hypothetical protein FD131_4887 [Rhodocyclaceae bacterium]